MILEDTLLTGKEYIKHAANIGEKHLQGRYGVRSIPSIEKCSGSIDETYSRIMSDGENTQKLQSIPSDEWIADNYHVVNEAAESVKNEEYSRKILPVYDLAAEIASHTDGCIGQREILDFVTSYEKIRPIETESLTFLPCMLQVALIKRIAEICKISDKIYKDRKTAEKIFREFSSYTTENGQRMRSAAVLFDNADMITPVFAETVLRLSAELEQNDTIRTALSGKLAAKGTTVEELIEREHRTRISLGVSMGNAIKSLRDLPSLDWDKIMSELCVTEQILRKDPTGIFNKMTSKSRREYLRIVQVCAKRKHTSPEKYALEVLEKAQNRQAHVGDFIYEDYTKHNDFGSFFVMFLFTSAVLAFCPGVYAYGLSMELYGIFGIFLGAFCVLLILIASMNISLSLIQKMYTDRKMPFSLPEMEFHGKLPEDCKIMIVLPCMITSKKRVDEMIKQLEAAYWANPQEGIWYTLLADLPESTTKTTPEDRELIQYAKTETEKLGERFCILVRERDFYKEDNKWMGYERKRGALIELNRAIIKGELPKVNYVLTVDADSVIPINTAVKMAQIMYHPLNRPQISYVKGEPVVTKGYGLLQPAISLSGLDRENTTIFEKIYSDEVGFDSYGCKTSDFYFDVCAEGIYTGKGMYDPYVFNGVLDGRFKRNSILSHDLLEGSFVRTAFVSDVHLYDSFPRSYGGYIKREHRWIRGDWQLLPFLGKRFENEKGVLKNNPLNFYSRFKIGMNLLRSLLPVALFMVFVVGMLFLRRDAFLWVFIVTGTLLITSGGRFVPRIMRALSNFILLPHTFLVHADGMIRAVWRTFRSRQKMLEWVVSSDADKSIQNTLAYYNRTMWINFASAAVMAPFLFGIPSVLWILGPWGAYVCSKKTIKQRYENKSKQLTKLQIKKFRINARKIWAFYYDYAVESDNFLPPDNVQFSPVYSVAHRTSPTNIGFLIVSTVIAQHFGYISQGEMLVRLEKIMNTLDRMDKWNGHIFNWYDTMSLQVLEPKYVSCVDSGNLAACLLAASSLINSINEVETTEDYIKKSAEGLYDTVCCLNEFAEKGNTVEIWVLEEFLNKDNYTKEEFLRVIQYYKELVAPVKNEKADAHSFRCNLKEMLVNAEKNITQGVFNLYEDKKILAARMKNMALAMDFGILYNDKHRHLCIGYNYSTGEFSNSFYDMIMSEARLTSYVAMAKGDVEAEHFSALARRCNEDGNVLLSWSGTVFEYVLPELFVPSPCGSALNKSIYEMLEIQQSLAGDKPWGISESGYNALDINMNYKYKAFGLKSLAVKRMHNDDAVVAPYASLMASSITPQAVFSNMELLSRLGTEGKYGYYEAIDFTPGRKGIVESFMAHHVGMALCGIANLLFDEMVSKGLSDMAMMQPVKVMLTEKFPKKAFKKHVSKTKNELVRKELSGEEKQQEQYVCISGHDAHVLSNGKYSVVINGQGNSYSSLCGMGIDVHREQILPEGIVFYLNGEMMKPVKCTVYSGSGEYLYLTKQEEVTQSICVATEDNAEVRIFKITNKGKNELYENITLYCRLMMDYPASYAAHPSYSGMFITTKAVKTENSSVCLLATRRKHKPTDNHVESYFYVDVSSESKKQVESIMYDTDVLSFKGRNGSSDFLLSGIAGTVLNPCFAVNLKLRVEAGGNAVFSLVMGMNQNKETAFTEINSFANTQRIFELARTRCLIEKEHISFRKGDMQFFRSYASKLLYGRKYYDDKTKKHLWGYGISGDNPIITVLIRKVENAVRLERLVRMWCYYSFRGIKLDMVLAVFDNSDYVSPIHELADSLVQRAMWGCFPVRGDIFVIVPKDSNVAAPIIEASNLVFWL